MSKEQLSVLDNFTLQHLKFKNCSPRIKQIVTSHKTFIGLPKEGSYPFFFLRSICRKVNDIIDQSEELLDWLDIDAFAKLKRPSNFVPHGDSLTPSKPILITNNQEKGKDKKRKREVKLSTETDNSSRRTGIICSA
jgi:hypothetical protein